MEWEITYALLERIKQTLSICDRFRFEDEIRGLKLQEQLNIAKQYMLFTEDYQRLAAEVCKDYVEAMETVFGANIDAIISCGRQKVVHGYFANLT